MNKLFYNKTPNINDKYRYQNLEQINLYLMTIANKKGK